MVGLLFNPASRTQSWGQRRQSGSTLSGITSRFTCRRVCVFCALAALCLCSPLLIVIPVTVHFSVVWETTRRQHWSHVSSLTRQFHHGQRMWSSSLPGMFNILRWWEWLEGSASRQSGRLKTLSTPQKKTHSARQTDTPSRCVTTAPFSDTCDVSETSRTNVTGGRGVLGETAFSCMNLKSAGCVGNFIIHRIGFNCRLIPFLFLLWAWIHHKQR